MSKKCKHDDISSRVAGNAVRKLLEKSYFEMFGEKMPKDTKPIFIKSNDKRVKDMGIKTCNECSWQDAEGGPSPIMVCNHPDCPKSNDHLQGCIICHPDCDEGFPLECPLFNR